MRTDYEDLAKRYPVIRAIRQEKEVVWINPDKTSYIESMESQELTIEDVDDGRRGFCVSRRLPCAVSRRQKTRAG